MLEGEAAMTEWEYGIAFILQSIMKDLNPLTDEEGCVTGRDVYGVEIRISQLNCLTYQTLSQIEPCYGEESLVHV